MAEFDYEVVNGRKIRVRPVETVSEVDENGYFHRQPNHFTKGFGPGENPIEKGRYRLVWAKLCHWSNRAATVRELEGLEDQISVNMVEHAPYEKNLGWEYVYNENTSTRCSAISSSLRRITVLMMITREERPFRR